MSGDAPLSIFIGRAGGVLIFAAVWYLVAWKFSAIGFAFGWVPGYLLAVPGAFVLRHSWSHLAFAAVLAGVVITVTTFFLHR